MIRVFAPSVIPSMDIIELQGQLSTTLATESTADKATSSEESKQVIPLGTVLQDKLNPTRCTLCINTLRVEGSRGTYKNPLLVLKRCSPERLETLRSSAHRRRRARCEEGQPSSTAEVTATVPSPSPSAATGTCDPTTMLFADWLKANPSATDLNALFLRGKEAVPRKPDHLPAEEVAADREADAEYVAIWGAVKDYEIVGLAEGYTLFHSKPARVFQ